MKQIFTLGFLFIILYSEAQPGANDPSFGINGVVIRKGIAGTYQDVHVNTNNKILAIRGYDDTVATITHYSRNGIPQKMTQLSIYIQGPYRLRKGSFSSILPQPNGRFLAAGTMYDLETTIFIARFNQDGSVDSSFAKNGVAGYTDGNFSTVRDFVVLPDNKLLLAVYIIYDAVPSIEIPALLRYMPDGTPDSSFGVNGVVTNTARYWRMGVQSDGKIILAGASIQDDIQLSRRNADGSPDLSFGKNGSTVIPLPYAKDNFFLNHLAIQKDDKIIIAARSDDHNHSDFYTVCARMNADGIPDNSFGDNGFTRSPFNAFYSFTSPNALALQADGKIIIGGELWPSEPSLPDSSFLARLNTDGSPDKSFGNKGYVKRAQAKGFAIDNIALQPDGRIVTCGSQAIFDEEGYYAGDHPSLARYLGDYGLNNNKAVEANSVTENKINIYPNPVTDLLYIKPVNNTGIQKVEVVSTAGRVLIVQEISAGEKTIPVKVRHLQPGVYLIRITAKTGKITSAIINKN